MPDAHARELALARAVIALNEELDLPLVLDAFLGAAAELTAARFAAINVLDSSGQSTAFYVHGMAASVHEQIGRPPRPIGVLGEIPREGTISLEEVAAHPASIGLPEGHPPLDSFLGAGLHVGGRAFGQLYLANKPGGFHPADEQAIQALAAAASVAIDHAQLYDLARQRERWLVATQRITMDLLSDPGAEGALQRTIDAALELSGAAAAALVLQGVDDAWVMEVTAGEGADHLLGLALPPGGTGMDVIRSGEGLIAAEPPGSNVLAPVMSYGPTLYAPLVAQGHAVGLLMLWRTRGEPEFDAGDLSLAQRFAGQAALALSLSELSHVKSVSALLEERAMLADDLHDFVSQELFATAMQIEAIAEDSDQNVATRLRGTLEHVKRAQHEVRGVMSSLAGQRSKEPIAERLRRELLLARSSLGFEPSVVAEWPHLDAAVVGDPTLADDLVAVTRELVSNVARHARAHAVRIVLAADEGRVEVRLEDDGIGPAGATQRHSGTSNLANRALRRNGTFSLTERWPGEDRPGCVAVWNVECARREGD
ncbi:sensor histidine kinase [Demequina muriae]|uniref:GAF domain-containing protein n=1 Tax=Demequina muriae TaxID=3051664 RepID=A0ABT8GIS9_9MICO|nr:GAF domain-containing protein [Demequina sp. EGI L300058]MDN4481338.1 GAF domain-containing protein [Demequina sp. EGI L300058]